MKATEIPGYAEALEAGQDAAAELFDAWWIDQVAEAVLLAAAPIIMNAILQMQIDIDLIMADDREGLFSEP